MIEMLLLVLFVLGAGVWTKRQNTRHMRRLHAEDYWQHGKHPYSNKKNHPIGPANKYLK